MATFQVPQFIEQEAKIVGFLTLKQFLYLAGAAIISFIAFSIFNFSLGFMVTLVVGGFGIGMAFVKINGQDLPKILTSALNYLWQPRIYTWQRIMSEKTIEFSDFEKIEEMRKNMTLQEKIKSVAQDITTGKFFSVQQRKREGKDQYEIVTYATGERKIAKKVDY